MCGSRAVRLVWAKTCTSTGGEIERICFKRDKEDRTIADLQISRLCALILARLGKEDHSQFQNGPLQPIDVQMLAKSRFGMSIQSGFYSAGGTIMVLRIAAATKQNYQSFRHIKNDRVL